MKKSIVVIFAVAIIGVLGLAANHHDGADLAPPSDNSGTLSGANTTNSQPAALGADSSQSQTTNSTSLMDGTYKGQSEFTPYGTVQIAAVVNGGRITDIKFLQMPGPEGHSKEVTAFAEPLLKDESIGKQTASIQFVSGATQTSEAYQKSLQAALDQAA